MGPFLFGSEPSIRLIFAYAIPRDLMGLDIGGFHERPDWPKIGPSLLIATSLILAIRTAKWPARSDANLSETDVEREIDHAAHLARRVLSALVSKCPAIFPAKKEPWYQANEEDVRK